MPQRPTYQVLQRAAINLTHLYGAWKIATMEKDSSAAYAIIFTKWIQTLRPTVSMETENLRSSSVLFINMKQKQGL